MDANGLTIGQSSFDWLWWLCMAIVVRLFITVTFLIFWLGKLPGEMGRARGHPQASAISSAGWLGLIFLPLWPIAAVWANFVPAGRAGISS